MTSEPRARRLPARIAVLFLVAALLAACALAPEPLASDYPIPTDLERVGEYPALVKSGGGYFYDEVLELVDPGEVPGT